MSQRDRQTDRQIERNGETDRQTDREGGRERQTYRFFKLRQNRQGREVKMRVWGGGVGSEIQARRNLESSAEIWRGRERERQTERK